ncbi:hypothetical protein [Methanosarcina sp. MTP4]|uniref:hypothetical protein n=1 Tax=Methanosarcina sp. MTP4 TaxID=1434100 RepID=UPI00064E9028|nr:hypothetical protein [Methanosarcina sp. MTP4]
MVFHKLQVFLLMLSTGTFLFFAGLLRKDLFEALKLGLYPATFNFLSGKIGAYFDLQASGNSALFSASAPIKVLFVATLTETAYSLLCHSHSKPEIPPTSPQADLVPVHVAMNKPRLFHPGFSKSMAGGVRTGQTSTVVHISNIRRKYETNKSVTK